MIKEMIKNLITTMRPYQWYKNFLLFAGIIFSLNIFNYSMWRSILLIFIFFCLLSGSEYIINDVMDIERDKLHPVKQKRPIALGVLNPKLALIFAFFLIVFSISGSFLINTLTGFSSLAYFILILLYTLYLKNVVIVDVIVISIGFVIRAIAGCTAINVLISPWLIVCTFLLALFLALGKRRNELLALGNNAPNHRNILAKYSINLLEQMISISLGALLVSYSLYTFFSHNYLMMLTIPFIIYGLFRYLYLIYIKNFGQSELMLKDRAILLTLIFWVIITILILYGVPKITLNLSD